ncbi:MAG: hypothetical protein G01um101416_619 [Microgenomates group bacterium Gr01-1014_16]|nr:MAG: hypothetical protein G01um101416_619 [Microgenomates group bacterium Gr01-1014_16]
MNTLKYITKIYKLALSSKSPIEIPNLSRAELAKVFANLGFTKGAQVGIWDGAYSKILCAANPKLTLFGIDINSRTDRRAVSSNCRLIRAKSQDAVKKVVYESLDFVYLDTDGDFSSQTNDIHEWSKKVRSGGVIAGHDYFRYRSSCAIRCWEAVHAYTQAYRISPWFVIGRNTDRVRSWFWAKA